MLWNVKIINKNSLKKSDQSHHIVYCPHSRLAVPQSNDAISILAAPIGWAHLHSSPNQLYNWLHNRL